MSSERLRDARNSMFFVAIATLCAVADFIGGAIFVGLFAVIYHQECESNYVLRELKNQKL